MFLAQIEKDFSNHVGRFEFEPVVSPWGWLWAGAGSVFWLAYGAIWIWMLIECIRKDPDRNMWVWIILIVPFGALFYFAFCWLPASGLRLPSGVRRFTRGREIERLAVAAQQIGNAHQFVQWGDGLRDVRQFDAAASAYASALAKEDDNRQALWGAGLVDFELKRYESARERLIKLLEIDPQYKFGDVSLVYGRTLYELNQRDAANEHLQKHVKRWRHPEAFFVLAQIAADRGDVPVARSHLQTMLLDINGCPRAIARRHGIWKTKAARLLKKLPPP